MVPFIDVSSLPERRPAPGWSGRFFHSAHMTFAYYTIAAGASVHPHEHPQEEVWHVIEGELEISLGGAEKVVRAGEAVIVPAGETHSVRTREACRVILV